jgi:hypothetical protein
MLASGGGSANANKVTMREKVDEKVDEGTKSDAETASLQLFGGKWHRRVRI